MAGIADGIIVIGDGITAGTAATGNGLRPKQARVAGLFFIRAAPIRCYGASRMLA